ncbi:MAG: helix-turn-helix domain-containing protein [Clostridia bacterium]|nr:helix-turn-helix domain-containing protein [Clostridia bacterium]
MKDNSIQATDRQELTISINHMTIRFLFSQGSKQTTGPEWDNLIRSVQHTHAYGELFMCYDVGTRINIEQSFVRMSPGDFLYVPPNIPHIRIIGSEDETIAAVGIQFSGRSAPDAQELRNHLRVLSDSGRPLILRNQMSFVQEWMDLLSRTSETTAAVSALLMVSLLTRMVSCGFEILTQSLTDPELKFGSDVKRIAELEYMIDSQFMTRLSREAVAEKLFISTRQLDRICKKRYGKTFHEQLTERRMVTAAAMLADTDMTADEISHAVGFFSPSNFYKAFSGKFGMTPNRYRKELNR